jgi:hypothetical protein
VIIYLAGPMTGHKLFNFPAFEEWAKRLRALGHEVISPAEMDRAVGFAPARSRVSRRFLREAMQRDFKAIERANAVLLLPGWEDSAGVDREIRHAITNGKPVLEASRFIADPRLIAPVVLPKDPPAEVGIETLENGARQSVLTERCDLLPPLATLAVARVMAYGAGKYGDRNWHGIPLESHLNHLLRHLLHHLAGDATEDHLEHAACRAMMALEKRYMGAGIA